MVTQFITPLVTTNEPPSRDPKESEPNKLTWFQVGSEDGEYSFYVYRCSTNVHPVLS